MQINPKLHSEIEELKVTVLNAEMTEPVQKVALNEIERLKKAGPSGAEDTIGINNIDYLVSFSLSHIRT